MKWIVPGLLLALAAPGLADPALDPCRPQALPAALDSVPPPPPAQSSIAFSAEPSLQYPGRAWVVRAYRSGRAGPALEIFHLRRRNDCNVYELEAR